MSKIDFNFCKENLKKKLKDRYRVKGICFSYSKEKMDILNEKKRKIKLIKDHFSYNDEIKKLINNFKSIKNDIITIEQRDKETKRILNQLKLFKDKDIMSYNNIYAHLDKLFKNFYRTKKKKKYFLQKSKINSEYDEQNNDLSPETINNLIKKVSANFFNAINRTDFGRKMNEEYNNETIKQYKKFFNFIKFSKRNHSEKIMKKNNIKNNNIYMNMYGNNNNSSEKNENTLDNSSKYYFRDIINDLLKQNNLENNKKTILNLSENDKNSNRSKNNSIENNTPNNLKTYNNTNYNKNKLINNIITESNKSIKEKIFNNNFIDSSLNEKILNLKTCNCNQKLYKNNKRNIFLKSFKNINSNKNLLLYNNNNNNNQNIFNHNNHKYILNNKTPLESLSLLTTNNNSNNRHTNYNTISFYDNNDVHKKRVKTSKVRNMPIYIAKITDFVKKYRRIKSKNKIIKLKRKENHWSTYSDIEKAFDIKEDMMMFLLKDKYLNSQFPKKHTIEPNKKKIFLKNLYEKMDILENNPFNNDSKGETTE